MYVVNYLEIKQNMTVKSIPESSKYLTEINPTSDSDDVHPEAFCNTCYLTAKRTPRTKQIRNPVKWLPHSDVHCDACDERCKGGRPKKLSSSVWPTIIAPYAYSFCCL